LNPRTNPDSTDLSLADYRWLLGDEAESWLSRVAEGGETSPAVAARLRRELSAERTHLVLQQAELRRRAIGKFSKADQMFFSPLGLEQASDEIVARHKAKRFEPHGPRADLCCGIGGDALSLAADGPTVCVERDPALALMAGANLRVYERSRAEVVSGDATRLKLDAETSWHIDPDRRPEGHRTTDVRYHSPNRMAIEELLAEAPHGAIKLAPATVVPAAWARQAELQWIGRDRQCRQQVAWFGRLCKQPGTRRATVLQGRPGDDRHESRSVTGAPGKPTDFAERPGRYIFEPDAAVMAADLSGSLAADHALAALSRDGGYLTGDISIDDPMMSRFEVEEVLPFDRKRIRQLLSSRGIGSLEIKKRGVAEQPEQLRRKLRLKGPNSAVLILARPATSTLAILAHRQ